jgi:hypothetical protein
MSEMGWLWTAFARSKSVSTGRKAMLCKLLMKEVPGRGPHRCSVQRQEACLWNGGGRVAEASRAPPGRNLGCATSSFPWDGVREDEASAKALCKLV